jgi:NADPH:quinone reductase-like Zn-dependent oxidoreductase
VVTCGVCPACQVGEELHCRKFALLSEGDLAGCLAEFVEVPAQNLLPLPDSVSAVAAACLPTTYLTAYRMLFTRARLVPGSWVLIQGATGGVATAALDLARAAGIRVVVSSRDPAKREAAVELGASAAISPEPQSSREVMALTGGRGVDAVLETVGEPTWELSLRSVRAGGAVVVSGATAGGNPPAQLARIFWRQLDVLGSTMGTRSELARLVELCAAGIVQPLVDSVLPLAEARAAFAKLAEGDRRGKLVLTPGSN